MLESIQGRNEHCSNHAATTLGDKWAHRHMRSTGCRTEAASTIKVMANAGDATPAKPRHRHTRPQARSVPNCLPPHSVRLISRKMQKPQEYSLPRGTAMFLLRRLSAPALWPNKDHWQIPTDCDKPQHCKKSIELAPPQPIAKTSPSSSQKFAVRKSGSQSSRPKQPPRETSRRIS